MSENIDPDQEKPKRKFIQVRVSDDQKKEIQAKAKEAGLTVTDFMLQAAGRVTPWTPANKKVAQEKIRQVARIGNNLNQIARAVNTQGVINHEIELLQCLQSIQEDLRKSLGIVD